MLEQIKLASQETTTQVSRLVKGQDEIIEKIFMAFVLGGHVLLEGPPGVAKTLVAKCFAKTLNLNFQRIQFTPDLMPSDVTGINIFIQETSEFKFCPGPLFTDVLLADEINRTPPKTQAALLEAMEEGQVTIDGTRYQLSDKFFVIATQNPLEHEGTYPLPEAQLDRFLFKLKFDYPNESSEKEMIANMSSSYFLRGQETSLLGNDTVDILNIENWRKVIREVKLSEAVLDYIYRIASFSRTHSSLALGASPRSLVHLSLVSKMNAALAGRDYVLPDDIQESLFSVFNHRFILSHRAYEKEESVNNIISNILKEVTVPS